MAGGSQPPRGNPGSVDGSIPEPYGVDPSIAPGLPRPQGWRVALPDGTGAWDKTGPLDTDWTAVSAAGAGYGGAPPDVAAANDAGVAATVSRSDHTHEGVHEITSAEPALSVIATAANRTVASRPGRLTQGLGLITETIVNKIAVAGNVCIDGTVYYMAVYLYAGEVITTAHIYINVLGAAMTLGKIGLYASDGTLLASTANQTTAWETTGLKSIALAFNVVTSGVYYLAIVAKGGVLPQIVSANNTAGVTLLMAQQPLPGGALPWGSQTGQTDLPSPGTIAAGTAPVIRWVGVS